MYCSWSIMYHTKLDKINIIFLEYEHANIVSNDQNLGESERQHPAKLALIASWKDRSLPA